MAVSQSPLALPHKKLDNRDMKIYHLVRSQKLPITQDVAWAFFANPANLLQLTPPSVKMSDESAEKPKQIYPGLLQILRMQLPLGFPATWVAMITHVEEPDYFIDVQQSGPFKFWHHRHQIIPIEGGVEIRDTIHYAMPFGFWGEVAHNLFVRNQLQELFDYRNHVLEDFFGAFHSSS